MQCCGNFSTGVVSAGIIDHIYCVVVIVLTGNTFYKVANISCTVIKCTNNCNGLFCACFVILKLNCVGKSSAPYSVNFFVYSAYLSELISAQIVSTFFVEPLFPLQGHTIPAGNVFDAVAIVLLLLMQVSVAVSLDNHGCKTMRLLCAINVCKQAVGFYGIVQVIASQFGYNFFQCTKPAGGHWCIVQQTFQAGYTKRFWKRCWIDHHVGLRQYVTNVPLWNNPGELNTQFSITGVGYHASPILFLCIRATAGAESVISANHFQSGRRNVCFDNGPNIVYQRYHAFGYRRIVNKQVGIFG